MLGTMYATIPVETESKTLQIGIGFASHQDAIWAAVRATAMARTGLHGTSPDLVLLVTAGVPAQDVVPLIRGVLGPVGTKAHRDYAPRVGARGPMVEALAKGVGRWLRSPVPSRRRRAGESAGEILT